MVAAAALVRALHSLVFLLRLIDDLEVVSRVAMWMNRLARSGGEVVDEDAGVVAEEEAVVVAVADGEEQVEVEEENRVRQHHGSEKKRTNRAERTIIDDSRGQRRWRGPGG